MSHCCAVSQQCGLEKSHHCPCPKSPCLENRDNGLLALQGSCEALCYPVTRECYSCGRLHKRLFQSVLKKRDQVQAEYEAKLEAMALRKEDRPKVREATSKGHGASG